jgi:hypothetical protein
MFQRIALCGLAVPTALLVAACSQSPQSPVSPSAAASSTAAYADGSTLKFTAPVPGSPVNGDTIEGLRPTFAFSNATAKFTPAVAPLYRIQLLDGGGNVIGDRIAEQGAGSTTYASDVNLANDTNYQWRVRAEFEGQPGPWSAVAAFKTAAAPVAGGAFTGGVGAQRSIGVQEAVGILIRVHDDLRYDLGRNSTRDSRNAWLSAAVAAVHYGHPRFNAAGPDPSWCIKNGGGGRPQSDDVLVLCQSRDAWDLVGGAGANGYFFHIDYIGRLPGVQEVYAPPVSALNDLNR